MVPTVPNGGPSPPPSSLASQGNVDTNAVIAEEINLDTHLSKISTTEQNVLAVYALNDKVDSSDLLVWPVLQIGKPGGPPPISRSPPSPRSFNDPPDDFTTESLHHHHQQPLGSQRHQPSSPPILSRCAIRITGTLTAPARGQGRSTSTTSRSPAPPTVNDSFDNFMGLEAPNATPEERAGTADIDGDSIANIHRNTPSAPTRPSPSLLTPVNGELKPIEPEAFTDTNGYAYIRFRLAGGNVTGNPGTGYEILDLNVRPQISFGGFGDNDWKDEVNTGTPPFRQEGSFVENNDGTVTITCRTIEREATQQRHPLRAPPRRRSLPVLSERHRHLLLQALGIYKMPPAARNDLRD